MSGAEADRWAWLLVLSFVFGCNVLRILLPSFSSFVSGCLAFPGAGGSPPRSPASSGVHTGVPDRPPRRLGRAVLHSRFLLLLFFSC